MATLLRCIKELIFANSVSLITLCSFSKYYMKIESKMWFLLFCLLQPTWADDDVKHKFPQEYEHDWYNYQPTLSPYLPGLDEPLPNKDYDTPDFREPEPVWVPRKHNVLEENRPYRVTPSYKKLSYIGGLTRDEDIYNLACYCNTVYKRLTLLAGCAILTTRHILTTASSTWLVLRDRMSYETLEDVLGLWYDTNHNVYNSSMYMTPARIHFHPLFHLPEHVNRSHPFPFTFDLAVWATTHNLYGWYANPNSVTTCLRATSHPRDHGSPVPTNEMFNIVGFQYIWAYKRKPMPWNKYMYRTFYATNPCPKSEWGWFICIYSEFLKYGIDSGAGLHRAFKGRSWRYNGLVGLGAFSMNLRSLGLTHYFTVLDCHIVLDFFYDSYINRQKPVWLDARFHDTAGAAPKPKYHIPHTYTMGEENTYFSKGLPL